MICAGSFSPVIPPTAFCASCTNVRLPSAARWNTAAAFSVAEVTTTKLPSDDTASELAPSRPLTPAVPSVCVVPIWVIVPLASESAVSVPSVALATYRSPSTSVRPVAPATA
jgi:hypothetical protein